MVKDMCFNGTMANTDKYSSPVPLVGLYIAVASMVCALLVLCDVWSGFSRRKYWFPCRFFSINSVTLTLISIAAKLPVDLTTNMPSKQDQLSKLCGNVFICVCMSFMLPAVATNAEFESYANVTALSIFVVTVVVNICIQIATGVIFSFMAEHVIILICMLLLLLRFWVTLISINALKNGRSDKGKELIRSGDENMLARLKLCYIYSNQSCLQLYACATPQLGDASIVCMMCSTILVQATLRSIAFKEFVFCQGVSDYGWSMWWVVGSQIFTVAVVTFAMGGRLLVSLHHFLDMKWEPGNNLAYLQFQYFFSLRNVPKFVEKIFKHVIYLPLIFIHFVLVVLTLLVEFVLAITMVVFACLVGLCSRKCCNSNWNPFEDVQNDSSEAYRKQLSARYVAVADWVLKKAVADMESWTAINEQVSLKHLMCLLSTVHPSRESSYCIGLNGEGVKISLLTLLLLVEIGKVVKATTLQEDRISIAGILDEVFEIIYFIEDNVNIGSSYDRLRSTSAKVIRKYGLTNGIDEFVLQQNLDLENCKFNFTLKPKPVSGICNIYDSPNYCIEKETRDVSDLINYHSAESREEVYGWIEQLFVDMLHAFLAQLPVAVFAHILESPVEKYQERVRLGLGLMCNLQSIESLVRFSPPPGANITSLFHTQTSVTCPQVQGVSTQCPDIAQAVPDAGEIQEEAQATEQIASASSAQIADTSASNGETLSAPASSITSSASSAQIPAPSASSTAVSSNCETLSAPASASSN